METLGLHHLGLSVSKLSASAKFFTDCLGWSVVREIAEHPAIFVSNGHILITLWQADDQARPFDRKRNIGLHHVAIKVPSEEALHEVFQLASSYPDVITEFSPEPIGASPAKHCMLLEPSGIRVEFIWLP